MKFTRTGAFAAFVGVFAVLFTASAVLPVASAATDGQLSVLINGQAPGDYCIAGPITVSGSGKTGGQGSTWHLVVKWGDGTPDTTSDNTPSLITSGTVAANNSNFTYETSHNFVSGSTSGLTVILYHVKESGQDGQVIVINQCVAAPTEGVVVLAKHVVNDNLVQPGTAVASDFTLSIGGENFTGSETGAAPGATLTAGTYSITETGPAGYTRTGTTCVDTSNNAVVSTDGSITVVAGKNYKCTVTNNDDAPVFGTLRVIKEVTGSNALPSLFTLIVKNSGNVQVGSAAGSATGTDYNLLAGVYTVSETPNAHYTAAFSGACNSNGVVTVADGTSVCTVTNTYFNTVPTALADAYSVDEDTTLTVSEGAGLLANDSDPEGDDLVAAVATLPAHGTVTVNVDGSFEYIPQANFNGTDSFTYTAYDSVDETAEVTVTITVNPVNDAPVAQDDADSTNEDTAVTTSDVRGNDNDVDGDALIVSAFDDASVEGGVVVNNGDGTFTYTPAADYVGSDSFTYTISDGSLEDTATVTINVSSENDAPVAVADTYTIDEDTTLTVDAANGVLDNDKDKDGDALTAVLDTDVTQGTLTLNSDGSFEYVPALNYEGPITFTYHAVDSNGASSNEVTVTITVKAVNDAPVAEDQSIGTGINTAKAGAVVGTDVDGDALTFEMASSTEHGVLDFFPNGLFTYTPNVNFVGSDFFTFFANDGKLDSNVATVSIDVSGTPEDTLDLCSDGEDNDNDDDVDLEDSDCAPFIPNLSIEKRVVGGDHSASSWTLTATLQDAQEPTLMGEGSASGNVAPGTYVIAEDGPGHYAQSIECSKGEVTLVGGNAVTLAIGDSVSCIITNTFTPYTSDLTVTKTVDDEDGTVAKGQILVYSITVSNDGPDSANTVVITDVLPAGLTFVSAVASQGSYNSETGEWSVGALSAEGEGSSATLTITATVKEDASGSITNTASASSENADDDSEDNAASASVSVSVPATPPTDNGGGGNRSGSRGGSVLGASTGEVLGASCGLYMDRYLKLGAPTNDEVQVIKLQAFLNTEGLFNRVPTGVFDMRTHNAVKDFQEKYYADILTPWGLTGPTGLVYLTTLHKINMIECPDLMLQIPPLTPWTGSTNTKFAQ